MKRIKLAVAITALIMGTAGAVLEATAAPNTQHMTTSNVMKTEAALDAEVAALIAGGMAADLALTQILQTIVSPTLDVVNALVATAISGQSAAVAAAVVSAAITGAPSVSATSITTAAINAAPATSANAIGDAGKSNGADTTTVNNAVASSTGSGTGGGGTGTTGGGTTGGSQSGGSSGGDGSPS